MGSFGHFQSQIAFYECLFVVLLLWDMIWKAVAMWKAARNNELGWFICIAVFNTIGILPIVYILRNLKKSRIDEEL